MFNNSQNVYEVHIVCISYILLKIVRITQTRRQTHFNTGKCLNLDIWVYLHSVIGESKDLQTEHILG